MAGAVTDEVARLTNVPWTGRLRIGRAAAGSGARTCINDLEALAFGVTVLDEHELKMLQRGVPHPKGNGAVIAARLGAGEALLLNLNGRLIPGASEGGHADFAPRTPREIEMLRELLPHLSARQRRAHPVGTGLVNVYQFTHNAFGNGRIEITPASMAPARLCAAVGERSTIRRPAEEDEQGGDRSDVQSLRGGTLDLRVGVRRRGGDRSTRAWKPTSVTIPCGEAGA